MLRAVFPLALVAAPLAAETPADPEVEVIDGRDDGHARMTVPVTIEGAGPFRFMVDTGSQATAVTRQIGERLALEPAGRATLVGMASRSIVDLVELDGLAIGSHRIDNIAAPVLESEHVGADGIVGLDALQDLRVLIDFRQDRIAIAKRKELGGDRGFEIVVRASRRNGQLIVTDAQVEGIPTAVIIDTGAQGTIGNLALKSRLRSKRATDVVGTDITGAQIVGNLAVARSLRLHDLEISDFAVTFVDSPAFAALDLVDRPAISLGMEHLRAFERVAIDFDTRRVLFDLPREVVLAGRDWHRRF